MDPRHPELAISRLRELMKQYDKVEKGMKGATTSAELAQLEREGSLVVQEICLVAPRIHEAMMQTSRQRRHDLTHGVLDEPQDTAVELGVRTEYEQPFEPVRENTDVIGEENIGGESGPVEEPVHKWSSAEKVAEAKEYLEQTIANSDVKKPVEKAAKKKTTKKAKK